VGQRVRGWVVVGVRSTGFTTPPSTSIPRTGACWLSVCCLLSSDLLLVLCTNLTFGCAVCLYGDYGANAGVIVGCISPVCFVHRFSSVRG